MSVDSLPRPRLYVSQEPGLGLFSAMEFGRVDDGQPAERWVGVGEHVGLLHDEPDGRCVGFAIKDVGDYNPDDPANAELWDGPRFDVPSLGLTDVPPNAVFVAARALFGSGRTMNRHLFSQAVGTNGEQALELWMRCLQAGDSMAHFALGYTLFELGRIPEAYRHLRHYIEIAPGDAWNWTWFGKAAAALGELEEARDAFRRAIAIDDERDTPDDERTEAAELLARLELGDVEVPPLQPDPPDWLAQLEELTDDIPCSLAIWTGDGKASVLFDAEWVPVRFNVDADTDEAWMRTQIGVALDDDEEMFELFEELGPDARGVDLDDDGAVWLTVDPPVRFSSLDVRLLEVLVRGTSATAARLFDAMTQMRPGDDPPLDAPPTFDELLVPDGDESAD